MDTSGRGSAVAPPAKRSWRRHSDVFKARVIEMARQPNTSVAAVALANGLNATMLRRWVRECELAGSISTEVALPREMVAPAFVQLPMHAPPSLPAASPEPAAARIEVEIQRQNGGSSGGKSRWPIAANVVFVGARGLGKTMCACNLAVQPGHTVLFTIAGHLLAISRRWTAIRPCGGAYTTMPPPTCW